jgi:pseudaminic acid synthase
MNDTIYIDGRPIGPSHKPYVIAELSGNHNNDLDRAFRIMEAAKESGVDAIKIQTYTADTMTIDHDGPDFMISDGPWAGYKLYELYQEASTPWEWHEALFTKAQELDITIFSTPFDETAVDFLEELGQSAYKVASFELTDHVLIEYIARTGKPMLMSTGMANLDEIKEAVSVARNAGAKDLVVLHCTSGYPTPISDSNLLTIPDLREQLNTQIGLSDHTLSTITSAGSVALGATVIEKHITMKRSDGGPDADFSLEPDEFKTLVDDCHQVWRALGKAGYDRKKSEEKNVVFRRSLYVVQNIKKGERLTPVNIRRIRPGHGLEPKRYPEILGRIAARDLPRGTALHNDDFV